MLNSPGIRQSLVAGSAVLAALSVGFSVTYPGVLLKQFASNESSIHLDLDTASWIGSIHGIAGIPSVIMPALMQWTGRKIMFIAVCLVSITGWVIAFTATSPASILISESFHGFGSHSLLAVGMLSMSEMLSPRYRNVTMPLYLIIQIIGMALVEIIGWHMNWRTVSIVMSIPIVVAVLIACMWTESPFWLASIGKFDKCTKAFIKLRGTSALAKTELEELILAQNENLLNDKWDKESGLKYFLHKLKRRDFYLPCIHSFVLMASMYWSGCLVVMIYGSEIYERATHSKDTGAFGSILLNYALLCSSSINIFLRYFKPKKVLLLCIICDIICLLSASVVNYSQINGFMSKENHICFYILVVFLFVTSLCIPGVMTMPAELMPVKHRGVAGSLYVIFSCILHSSSLKLAPYLFKYINLWGTLLLYAVNAVICGLFIWKYLPEAQGRTLQQLEDYYTYGNFDKRHRPDVQMCVSELIPNQN